MFFCLVFVALLVFALTVSQNVTAPKTVTWVMGNSANPSSLEPAGEDLTGILYIARAYVNGEWIPGKGYYRSGVFYANVEFMGKNIESMDCQALLRGGTKWVPQQKSSPISAVLAGYDPTTYERTYICRGFVYEEGRPWLSVGKVLENLDVCRLPFNGETKAFCFDVLVYDY